MFWMDGPVIQTTGAPKSYEVGPLPSIQQLLIRVIYKLIHGALRRQQEHK